MLQLATCTAAAGHYLEARDQFQLFVDALLRSASSSVASPDTVSADDDDDDDDGGEGEGEEWQRRQAVFLLSSPPERRKQYVFALRALVTIYTELGDNTGAKIINGALVHID